MQRELWLGAILLIAAGAMSGTVGAARAQTFTKITTGAPVTDGGASRSVNWVDIDNDGRTDLFVTNGPTAGQNNFLYTGDGAPQWTFTKVTGDAIVQDGAKSDGSSWGDYDNDGDLDCFVVNWYGDNNLFYVNSGDGTFAQVFDGAPVNDGGHSETCSWGDYDADGWLDLYVTNSGDGVAEANFLYHNDGDGTFTRVTTGPIVEDAHLSRGANWVDYDDDGDLDMFVTNESNQANDLYRNRLVEDGTATFTKVIGGAIVTETHSSFSGSWGDYDTDGDLDCFVANWGNQADDLYNNVGGGNFSKVTTGIVVTDPGYSVCSGWGDCDNDGDLDLFVTNAYGGARKRNYLYMNRLRETGTATFEKVTAGDLVTELGWTYGFAWGDYDADGDLDLFMARTWNDNENNALYRNDNANGNHWIELSCEGIASNRSAIGAKVRCRAVIGGQPVWQMDQIAGQTGYCGQRLMVHFGLGGATVVDTLRIEWPSGTVDVHTSVPVDRLLRVREGELPADVHGAIPGSGDSGSRLGPLRVEPNPLRGEGTIRCDLRHASDIDLRIVDVSGREVALVDRGRREAGSHAWRIDVAPLSRFGVLFARLRAGGEVRAAKLTGVR